MTQRAILIEGRILQLEVGAGVVPFLDEGFAQAALEGAVWGDGDSIGSLFAMWPSGCKYEIIEDVDARTDLADHARAIRAAIEDLDVGTYFDGVLGEDLDTDTDGQGYLEDFPISSPCGQDCRHAIDAAHRMLHYVRGAFGRGSKEEAAVVAACRATVLCYMHG